VSETLGLDPLLLEILACPCEAHAALEVDGARQLLVCTVCFRGFPVRDGIPVMLLDEALPPTTRDAPGPQDSAEA
jgi:uncharacterized protein YbaR (Trm112 family)